MANHDSIGEVIFEDKSYGAEEAPLCGYAQSHICSQRQCCVDVTPGCPTERYSDHGLSDLIDAQERLGPYEKHVFGTVLKSPGKVIVIQNFAGCGKISTLHYTSNHFPRHRRLRCEPLASNLNALSFQGETDRASRSHRADIRQCWLSTRHGQWRVSLGQRRAGTARPGKANTSQRRKGSK